MALDAKNRIEGNDMRRFDTSDAALWNGFQAPDAGAASVANLI